jgi:hypothetical protein
MKILKFCPMALALFVLTSSLAFAQASRTWVSGVGDDANPCSRTAPCKTFAGAISKTAAGGEIDALDPAGYGAVTITKAITIDGGGGQVASVLVAGTNGIVVQAGASDVVILRNLRINGISGSGNGGINGIRFLAGKALDVENCDIFGFTNNGIDIALGASAQVTVKNTTVTNVTQVGLRAVSTAGTVQVSIDESQFTLNGFGVWADSNSKVDVTRSRAAGNSAIGFISQATAAGASTMDVDTSFTVNNGVGLQAGGSVGPSNLFVSRTFVADNATGVVNGGNGTSHGWTPANNPSKDTGSFNGGAQPTI